MKFFVTFKYSSSYEDENENKIVEHTLEYESKNLDELNLSKTAMGFFSESKKVSNKKLLNNLNYKLIHPDYFSGMADIFKKLK